MRLKSGRAVKNNDLGTEQMVALRSLRAGLVILLFVLLVIRSLAGEKVFQLKLLKPSNRPPESAAAPPIKPLRPSAAMATIPDLAHFFPIFSLLEPASAALENALAPRIKLLSCIRRRLLLISCGSFRLPDFAQKLQILAARGEDHPFTHREMARTVRPQRLEASQKPLIESLGAIGIDTAFGVRVQVSAAPKTVFRIDGALERLTKIINGVSEASVAT